MHGTFTATVQEFCGARFSYRRSGRGEPVLLLHASACSGGSWDGFLDELSGDFSYYTPDLAGYALFAENWGAPGFQVLQCPTAVLKGVTSPPLVLRTAEILAERIPQAQLNTVPGVGHMAPVTYPQQVAHTVADCLRVTALRAA